MSEKFIKTRSNFEQSEDEEEKNKYYVWRCGYSTHTPLRRLLLHYEVGGLP